MSTTRKSKKVTSTIQKQKKYLVQMILMLIKYQFLKKNNKYFIGYNDNDVISPLYLGLPQTAGYINKFDEDKNKIKIKIK